MFGLVGLRFRLWVALDLGSGPISGQFREEGSLVLGKSHNKHRVTVGPLNFLHAKP